jgi:diaminohydroxyphosphoribosylaminopyrimidine deaminase/5-amino-6-(5-phosphoribosylamino)uracil reductase
MTNNPHDIFMQRCIQLAKSGLGHVAPNPMVGAVLVHNAKIIGEGYHHKYGEAHAEVNAIGNIDETILKEATLYVSLEPCTHFGKTPPCTDLIISKGIKKVVVGCIDPYVEVAGKGIEKMKAHGIEVITEVCEQECIELNKRFFTAIEKKRPYIILKYAQTADGFIGIKPGSDTSRQISNAFSQRLTHKWRTEESGILIGTNTALLDNPELNARFYGDKNPIRIVFDKDLKISPTHHLFDGKQTTIVFTESETQSSNTNIVFIKLDFNASSFLREVLKNLLSLHIQSILIEGGTITLQQFINAGLWDEARVFTAPVTWGKGTKAPNLCGDFSLIEEDKIASDTLTIYKNMKAECL